ncbi:hypothetical protein K2173_009256 [Erythroxylum novogranatense]|uniref:Late embryogenesis abundant protein LEA-2 subgroup domain-containing protein n=1 Tax=Erythroxylum novogranatense TaxID=1862640 RepID=A0AAV8S5R6_9ROSI|nr:hypothetical protein K2173_009256 [Erythroxylum novogranatense]
MERGGCGRCCFSFIFTSGLTALFMWLSLRTSSPKCLLQDFYIPALNRTLNTAANTTLYFHLRLENTNKDKRVYYDPSHSIANYTIPAFRQGHKKKATKAVLVHGSAVFRVDMATSVRYKIMFWKTKREKIMVGADVPVNDQGTLVDAKKGIKLKSDAAKASSCFGKIGVSVISFLMFAF